MCIYTHTVSQLSHCINLMEIFMMMMHFYVLNTLYLYAVGHNTHLLSVNKCDIITIIVSNTLSLAVGFYLFYFLTYLKSSRLKSVERLIMN